MQYSEFVDLCSNRGISAPSWDAYTNIMEFVYAYHPLFEGGDRKEKCVDLYVAGGLHVFRLMREEAAEGMRREERIRELRAAMVEAYKAFEDAQDEAEMWKESVRNDYKV